MSMAHSLEVRPPFLDHRLIEFASTLPNHLKVRGRTLKVILKSLMKSKLPPSVIRRSKNGLDIPTQDWFRGPLRQFMEDTLSPAAVKRTSLFRPQVIERLKKDHLERRANFGYHIWGLLILFLWIKHWNIQTSSELNLPLGMQESISSQAFS
jgi:asparagine synthase (glutamine-hydrolysing)